MNEKLAALLEKAARFADRIVETAYDSRQNNEAFDLAKELREAKKEVEKAEDK